MFNLCGGFHGFKLVKVIDLPNFGELLLAGVVVGSCVLCDDFQVILLAGGKSLRFRPVRRHGFDAQKRMNPVKAKRANLVLSEREVKLSG